MAETSKVGGSRDGSVVLPEEVIVWEILIRLPAKALHRCRTVCRSWHRLTSAPDFLLAHYRNQPSLPLVFSTIVANSKISSSLDAFDLRQRPTERQHVLRLSDNRRFQVHASCDGLILLSAMRLVYLCNPSTHQWIALPSLNDTHIVGMYSHRPSGEYRVLYWTRADKPSCCVLTIGSSKKPRRVKHLFASKYDRAFVEGRVRGGLSLVEGPAILLHDCLHWFNRWGSQEAIVVFHTVTESIRLIHLPTYAHVSLCSPSLLEKDGTLGIIWESKNMLELSVLQDYETEAWSLKYQVKYPMAEMGGAKFSLCGTVISDDGDTLIHCYRTHQLFHLDRNGKLLQKFRWRDTEACTTTGFWFKESLLRHAFFEGPRGDGHLEQSSFFGGSSLA